MTLQTGSATLGPLMETKVCIIGAGPAGLMSAIFAAQAGAGVTVFEKNNTAGRKLLLTGGGRCNLTHTGTVDDFIRVYGKSGRFLRHCLHEFSPDATREFFAELGLATKVDEDGCVFPISERAGDVRDALLNRCQKLVVQFVYGRGIERIEKQSDEFFIFAGGESMSFQKVIIAAGGASYPQTGSTGDGYKLAKSLGHTIIEPRPALVPLVTKEDWPRELAGTSLGNVKISAVVGGKKIVMTGPMIFTHDGIGGPAVLDLSRLLTDYLPSQKPIEIVIDVIPAMNESKLEEYLMGQLSLYSRKIIVNVLFDLIPKKIAGLLCRRAGIAETTGSQLKKEQRRQLIQLLKKLPFSIQASRPIEEATITRGGVATNEIDQKTMQSKVCPNLFFAGEVIDIDGPCGGYNLQICWSTGALACKISAS
ncbi:MAG: NAD(P)/FAD-dependent oxidoreductase [Planctomycetota bacterium]